MPDGKVTLIKAVAKKHDCQAEIVQALAPVLDTLGAGSIVQCSCGDLFERGGDTSTGFYWTQPSS